MSTAVTDTAVSTEATTERVMCFVKWFDSKKGWGFASTLDEPHRDIFVHHKAIVVAKEQFRYLVQGEYVELDIVETTDGQHQFQAGNVSGIRGGALMCETREAARVEQESRDNERMTDDSNDRPRRSQSGRGRGSRGPRGNFRGRGPREGMVFRLVSA